MRASAPSYRLSRQPKILFPKFRRFNRSSGPFKRRPDSRCLARKSRNLERITTMAITVRRPRHDERVSQPVRWDVDRDVIQGATLIPTRILRMMWNNTLNLTNHRLGPALLAVGLVISAAAVAQNAAPAVVAVTPPEMKWSSQGPLAAPGMEQLNLVGDPAKPGPYTLRLKFPKGLKIAPHTHPDSREVTILSGVFAIGYGEKFDAANLKILPAGSFYTEPANVPHFIEIEEDTVLQVSGTGPSGRKFVNPFDNNPN
jgi:quercetin dioxygenase-like cupin family protein